MIDKFYNLEIVSPEYFFVITQFAIYFKYTITDVIKLDNKYLIKYIDDLDLSKEIHSNKNYNINIALTSAITAGARIEMSKFKNNPKLKIYYTDTDSIYTN